ncbi:fructose-bisphosphate aldolase class I [Rhizobium sp. BK529]|uniref:fructose bisphosphate aldolase n=1 Tax=Rhizobium sp. BK529 TaxID=2586983 RepID=UPI00160F5460|nr:fructose bisphosphate aldolase [Rhizobium sp. BK529]MBB3595169.1 fructose-bisphosphate aldolase class I [Rhizobium sp. BK529]
MLDEMTAQMTRAPGFVAALDQSGGSTPEALRLYGIPDSAYSSETEMFNLIHEMRLRIITSPAFFGNKIIAAILFEKTMDSAVEGESIPSYLWRGRHVVPLLKVDSGREHEHDGVQMMKPMPGLDTLLKRAVGKGIFGTKMRSVVRLPSRSGIAAVVAQQFDLAKHIASYGLTPIIEPEVLITSPDKEGAEAILRDEIIKGLESLPANVKVMLKLTIPTVPDLYKPFVESPNVMRVLALSGGYSRGEACAELRKNKGVIASFSRALVEDLRVHMTDAQMNDHLARSADEIFQASVNKQ